MRSPIAMLVATALVVGPAIAARADGDARFTEQARMRYIRGALSALRTTSAAEQAAIADKIHLGARTTCTAGASEPSVRCLLGVARAVCRSRSAPEPCSMVADLVMTNLMGEKQAVPSKVRLTLMNHADGYRASLSRHLMGRYAILVARLSLAPGFDQGAGLATSIDGFCRTLIRKRSTTWGRCVSAIVWYIGTSEPSSTKRSNKGE